MISVEMMFCERAIKKKIHFNNVVGILVSNLVVIFCEMAAQGD